MHVAWCIADALCISLGDEGAELAACGGNASWIAWRYPQSRPVRLLVIEAAPAELLAATIELWYAYNLHIEADSHVALCCSLVQRGEG